MNQTTLDPYAVLGVPRGATERQVRQAYRQLAKRYHPDLHAGGQTGERMQRVNQAWEILSSPTRRAAYDAESSLGRTPSAGHWSASRPATPVSPSSATWNGTWTSPPPTPRAYAHTGSAPYDEADGPAWPGVVLAAIGAVLFVVLFAGLLPFPLFGIAVFLLVRGIFGRFDPRTG